MPKSTLKASVVVDADDSSDEEEVSEKAEQYDIKESYKEFIDSDDIPKYIKETDPKGYSFIAFALGMQKLYSPEVNRLYYEKKHALPPSKIVNTEKEIEQWLKNALFRTIRRVFLLKTQAEITRDLAAQFIKNLGDGKKLKAFIERACQNLRTIFKQLQSEAILPEFESLLETVVSAINLWIEELDEEQIELSPPPPIKYDKFANAVRSEITEYLKDKNIINEDGKFAGKTSRPAVTETDKIKKMILTESKKYDGRKNANSIPDRFVRSLFEAQLQRDADKEEGVLESTENGICFKQELTEEALINSDISHYFLDDDGNIDRIIFKKYSYYTFQRLTQELLADVKRCFAGTFLEALHETKRELKIKLRRGLLEQQHRFVSNDPIEFLSNLRLNIRIQKRRVRQEQEELGKKALRTEAFQMAWQFGHQTYLALETQEITTKGGRSDMVINLESYKGIAEELSVLEFNANRNLDFKVNNKLIAYWVQNVLEKGEPKTKLVRKKENAELKFDDLAEEDRYQFNKFLIDFTYLIMGCEVQRQPSGICTHLLMLNLIQKSELTWKQAIASEDKKKAFGGGMMPMSMGSYKKEEDKKAVAHPVLCARFLQQHYGIFSVRPYAYPGESAKESGEHKKQIVELIEREKDLIEKWLENCEINDETIEDQIDSISDHIDSVYKPRK